jgi:hypothetical protein
LSPRISVTLSIAAYAQEFRGTISGTVTDPAGAIVPNAKVTAVETGTNTKAQTTSLVLANAGTARFSCSVVDLVDGVFAHRFGCEIITEGAVR